MTTASVGKVFTALLAVRVHRDRKIPLSTSISTYLPSLWPQAQAIASLSFLDLLTHKSGLGAGRTFVDGETDMTFARRMIALGPTGPGGYHNVNYILLRILIYQILSFSGKDDAIPLTPPTALDVNWAVQDGLLQDRSATFFDELAHAKIFNPAGVTASLDPPPGRAWHYRWPNLGQHGELGDISGVAGSGG